MYMAFAIILVSSEYNRAPINTLCYYNAHSVIVLHQQVIQYRTWVYHSSRIHIVHSDRYSVRSEPRRVLLGSVRSNIRFPRLQKNVRTTWRGGNNNIIYLGNQQLPLIIHIYIIYYILQRARWQYYISTALSCETRVGRRQNHSAVAFLITPVQTTQTVIFSHTVKANYARA